MFLNVKNAKIATTSIFFIVVTKFQFLYVVIKKTLFLYLPRMAAKGGAVSTHDSVASSVKFSATCSNKKSTKFSTRMIGDFFLVNSSSQSDGSSWSRTICHNQAKCHNNRKEVVELDEFTSKE